MNNSKYANGGIKKMTPYSQMAWVNYYGMWMRTVISKPHYATYSVILPFMVINLWHFFYCTYIICVKSRQWPVHHVCHHVTCHRRLFSLSRTCFIALFMPIHFPISATPNSQRTLFTYLWYMWRQLWRCAKYSNSVYVAAFRFFCPSARRPHVRSAPLTFDDGGRQFTMCHIVISVKSQKVVQLCYWG